MCGITGFIDYKNLMDKNVLISMTDKLNHRGPDGSGYHVWSLDYVKIGLGHRRLSILDLSQSGSQPMSKHGLHITYNGEIYNYREIRVELIEFGYVFVSDSDTEVILSAFDCWDIKAVDRFIGMFAFSIYSEKKEQIFLFRDRAGVKPLFYYWKDEVFLFSSELKTFHQAPSFTKELSLKSLAEYFQYGYISTPNCIFENCYKLEQGHYLVFNLHNQKFTKHKYWDVFDYAKTKGKDMSEQECLKTTEDILTSACNYRMVSDVPVGVFLSGGYDSSLVTALVQKERTQKVKTYTIAFEDDQFNEAKHASRVAKHLGTDHHEMICSTKEAKCIVPLLPEICDEPFGDSSIIPTYLVSKMARNEVKVALSSDGGDEQFIGYNRYLKAIRLGLVMNKFPKFVNSGIGYLGAAVYSKNRIHDKIWQSFKSSKIASIPAIQTQTLFTKEINQLIKGFQFEYVKDDLSYASDLNTIFAAEYQKYMQDDIMVKVDRASMAVGLEGREPLLDHRIAEWTLQLPLNLKYKDKKLKFLLKEITHKYIPNEIMDRPKQGFAIPVISWLRADMAYLIDEYFAESRIKSQGLFNYQFIEEHLKQFKNKNPDSEIFIWFMLVFQIWFDKWMG